MKLQRVYLDNAHQAPFAVQIKIQKRLDLLSKLGGRAGGLIKQNILKSNYARIDGRWYLTDHRFSRLELNKLHECQSIEVCEKLSQFARLYSNDDKNFFVPLITICTVTFNAGKTLLKTIESVSQLNYPNLEYIIIDGGSNDETIDIIQNCSDAIDFWISEGDRGIFDAMNKGIDYALGAWICFIGAGDEFVIRDLGDLFVDSLGSLPEEWPDVLYGNANVIDNNRLAYTRYSSPNVDDLRKNFIFLHPDSFTKTALLEDLNKFDLNYKLAADYEFYIRAWLNHSRFKKVDLTLVNFQVGGFSANFKLNFYEKLRIWRAYKKHLSVVFLFMTVYQYILGNIKDLFKLSGDHWLIKVYRKLVWS